VQVTGLDVSTPMLAVAARRTQGKVALAEAEAVTLGRAIWLVDAVRSI
jgi:predicted TPR repeat methyltransferase